MDARDIRWYSRISGPHSSKLTGTRISRLSADPKCHLYWRNAAHNRQTRVQHPDEVCESDR